MTPPPCDVLVTGASGNIGSQVVRACVAAGSVVRAAAREVQSDALVEGSVDTATLDFLDPSTWKRATAGARHMFLMRPPAIADVEHSLLPFIDAARQEGVEHIVFLSVAGAARNRLIPHRRVEEHLEALGPEHTLLRPGFFAQNLASSYREDIVSDDRIYVPAGRAPVNWIDGRDIAEVVATILSDPGSHRARAYTLTGPGPVPWADVTATLSAVAGRDIRYQPASVLGYMAHLRKRGRPWDAIAVQTVLHALLRFGSGTDTDPTIERLLERPPGSIHQYIRDHASLRRHDNERIGSE